VKKMTASTKTKTPAGTKTKVAGNGAATETKPSEQALQVVDHAVGVVPVVADAVRSTFDRLGEPDTRERGAVVRRQVTDQVVERARRARHRVEPVYRQRVEPVYKRRVEPVVRERFAPVYRDRVEPAVRRVRERI
jgi:hypothetical protein